MNCQEKLLFKPIHLSITALSFAAKQDYDAFYQMECIFGGKHHYPPLLLCSLVTVSHEDLMKTVSRDRKNY